MSEKSDLDIFLEHFPAFHNWYKIIVTYLIQFLIFICAVIFLFWISSTFLIGALLGQIIVVSIGISPYFYLAFKSGKIREKYTKKFKNLAAQKLWYNFIFYAIPLLYSSMYFPLILKSDYIPPVILTFPSHFLTRALLPFYIVLPVVFIILVFGILIRRPSGGFGIDVDSYIYYVFPEKSKLITRGTYEYIRNPRYLSRFIIVLGVSIFSNNLLAILAGLIHIFAFISLMKLEDKELERRFGNDFVNYKKKVPSLLPKYGDWINFTKFIFKRN